MMKQIRYFVFRYKEEVVYQKFVTDMKKQNDFKGKKNDKIATDVELQNYSES